MDTEFTSPRLKPNEFENSRSILSQLENLPRNKLSPSEIIALTDGQTVCDRKILCDYLTHGCVNCDYINCPHY